MFNHSVTPPNTQALGLSASFLAWFCHSTVGPQLFFVPFVSLWLIFFFAPCGENDFMNRKDDAF